MTKRKSYVMRIASEIRKEYPDYVVINITKTLENIKDLNKYLNDSITDEKKIFVLGRNNKTNLVFRYFEGVREVTKINNLIILSNGNTTMSSDDSGNLDIKMIKKMFTKKNINELECQLCNEKIQLEARQCDSCLESFCICCQIKLIITGTFDGSFSMTCPFCRHNHIQK